MGAKSSSYSHLRWPSAVLLRGHVRLLPLHDPVLCVHQNMPGRTYVPFKGPMGPAHAASCAPLPNPLFRHPSPCGQQPCAQLCRWFRPSTKTVRWSHPAIPPFIAMAIFFAKSSWPAPSPILRRLSICTSLALKAPAQLLTVHQPNHQAAC